MMMMKKTATACLSAVAVLTFASGSALAGTDYSFCFEGVSNNHAGNTAIGEAQFELQVTDVGGDALFTFLNNGPAPSVMSELYWDDDAGVLASMLSITDNGTDYESVGSGVSPGNLPAGNTISFDADFATEPNNPSPHNGVNPGDSVGVLFDLTGSFADVIAAIQAGELRIGIHAQSIGDNGNSESFVNCEPPVTGVPTPSAAALGLVMLVGAGARRRRR